MNLLDNIKKWPLDRKRNFSIISAAFLTILIIILNSAVNIWWPDTRKKQAIDDKALKNIKETFTQAVDQTQPIFDQLFVATSSDSTEINKIVEQNNSTTSSFGTSTNVVE